LFWQELQELQQLAKVVSPVSFSEELQQVPEPEELADVMALFSEELQHEKEHEQGKVVSLALFSEELQQVQPPEGKVVSPVSFSVAVQPPEKVVSLVSFSVELQELQRLVLERQEKEHEQDLQKPLQQALQPVAHVAEDSLSSIFPDEIEGQHDYFSS
jgi:predicted NodU family carbamoyl transferase